MKLQYIPRIGGKYQNSAEWRGFLTGWSLRKRVYPSGNRAATSENLQNNHRFPVWNCNISHTIEKNIKILQNEEDSWPIFRSNPERKRKEMHVSVTKPPVWKRSVHSRNRRRRKCMKTVCGTAEPRCTEIRISVTKPRAVTHVSRCVNVHFRHISAAEPSTEIRFFVLWY